MASTDMLVTQDGNTIHTYLLPTTNNMRQVAVGERMIKNLKGSQCCALVLGIIGMIGTVGLLLAATHGCFNNNQDESTRSICEENYDANMRIISGVAAGIGDLGSCIACCLWYKSRTVHRI